MRVDSYPVPSRASVANDGIKLTPATARDSFPATAMDADGRELAGTSETHSGATLGRRRARSDRAVAPSGEPRWAAQIRNCSIARRAGATRVRSSGAGAPNEPLVVESGRVARDGDDSVGEVPSPSTFAMEGVVCPASPRRRPRRRRRAVPPRGAPAAAQGTGGDAREVEPAAAARSRSTARSAGRRSPRASRPSTRGPGTPAGRPLPGTGRGGVPAGRARRSRSAACVTVRGWRGVEVKS